jgi:hypothetical protein
MDKEEKKISEALNEVYKKISEVIKRLSRHEQGVFSYSIAVKCLSVVIIPLLFTQTKEKDLDKVIENIVREAQKNAAIKAGALRIDSGDEIMKGKE